MIEVIRAFSWFEVQCKEALFEQRNNPPNINVLTLCALSLYLIQVRVEIRHRAGSVVVRQ